MASKTTPPERPTRERDGVGAGDWQGTASAETPDAFQKSLPHERMGLPGGSGSQSGRRIVVGYVRQGPGYPLSAIEQAGLIRSYAARLGLTVQHLFIDKSTKRATGRAAMLRIAEAQPSLVIVTSPSRLADTVVGTLRILAALRAVGATLHVASDDPVAAIQTTSIMEGVGAVLAIHADLHREAVARGRSRARLRGVAFGRPKVPPDRIERARLALRHGASIREAARRAGISAASVLRHAQV